MKRMRNFSFFKFHYGQVIASVCFSIQAIGIGVYIAYGVFFNPLMAEFGWSRAVLSGASSVAFFIMGVCGIWVGRLNDRFGPRKIMVVTAVFLGTGYLLMSRLTAIWQLYLLYGIVFGIGLSSVDVIALSTIARWYTRKRGMMTGIVKVGTGAGQLTLPLLASFLIAAYGWRTAYLIIGTAAMLILVTMAQLLRRDPGERERWWDRPNPHKAPPRFASANSVTFEHATHTAALWIICCVNFTLVFCLMTVMVHIVPHARDIGIAAAPAAGVLSAIGGISMLGRFVTGIAIDYIGSKRVMIICFVLLLAGLLWLQIADTLWMLMMFACVYGIAHGGFFTAISPIVAEQFGIGFHGALFGLVVCFGTTGGAIGPFLAGWLFDSYGSYSAPFWLVTAISTVGFGLILALKPAAPKEGEKS